MNIRLSNTRKALIALLSAVCIVFLALGLISLGNGGNKSITASAEDSTTITTVSSADDLSSLSDGGYYQLTTTIEVSSSVTISSGTTVTIDLNGNTLSASTVNTVTVSSGGSLTVVDSASGGTISNTSTGAYYAIENNATLNITGGTITAVKAVYQNSGTLTMTGGTVLGTNDDVSGATTWPCGIRVNAGTANITGGTVSSYVEYSSGSQTVGYAIYSVGDVTLSGSATITAVGADKQSQIGGVYMSQNGQNSLTVNDGATIKATYESTDTGSYDASGILIFGNGNSESAPSLTINGGTIYGQSMGITGNGSTSYMYTEITINGGEIEGGILGIYHPQVGDLTITGGSVTGVSSAIEIRAGSLNISGGTFTATSESFSATANGNGTTITGAAIAISQHTTNYDLTVTITGGTFSGYYAVYETDLQDSDTSGISATLTGGTYETINDEEGASAVASTVTTSEDGATTTTYALTVTGGTYNTDVSTYTASGLTATETSESSGTYTISLSNAESYSSYAVLLITSSGVVGYDSISSALQNEAIYSDGSYTVSTVTIWLNGDVTDNVTIPAGLNVTIDLCGKTLTNSSATHTIIVESGATLTINDTVGGGKVANTVTSSSYCVKYAVDNLGTLVVNGGTYSISVSETGTSDYTNLAAIYNNSGMAVINDATITATGTGSTSTLYVYGVYNYYGTATVKSSTITVSSTGSAYGVMSSYGTTTVSDCDIDVAATGSGVSAYGVYDSYGTVTISGGTIDVSATGTSSSSVSAYGAYSWSSLTVNDTDITSTGTNTSGRVNVYGLSGQSSSTVTVNGGDISATTGESTSGSVYGILSPGEIVITDGTISATSTTASTYSVYSKGSLTMTGGEIDGDDYSLYIYSSSSATITAGEVNGSMNISSSASVEVSGGTYDADATASLQSAISSGVVNANIDLVSNEDGTYTAYTYDVMVVSGTTTTTTTYYTDSDAVTEGYADALAWALSAIGETEGTYTITLGGDYELTTALTVASSQTITLDLNGYELTVSWYSEDKVYTILNNGTLTIKDSLGTGTLYLNGGNYGVYNNGTLNVTSGTVANESTNVSYRTVIYNNGTVTVSGGTLTADYIGILNYGAVVLDGGTISVTSSDSNAAYGVWNISSTSSVTVNDGSIEVQNAGNAYGIYQTVSGGTITVNGGTISATRTASTARAIYVYHADGTVTITGGTIKACNPSNTNNTSTYAIQLLGTGSGDSQNAISLTVTGGTLSGYYGISNQYNSCELTVSGCTITSQYYGIFSSYSGKTSISGNTTITVTYSGSTTVYGIAVLYGDLEISDSVSISATSSSASGYAVRSLGNTSGTAYVTINGGTFSGNTAAIQCADYSEITIKDGTLSTVELSKSTSKTIISDSLNVTVSTTLTGYEVVSEASQTLDSYTEYSVAITENSAYAYVIDSDGNIVYYDTLSNAQKAATDGSTIVLLKDCSQVGTVSSSKSITIDLNGYNITYSSTVLTVSSSSSSVSIINSSSTTSTISSTSSSTITSGISYAISVSGTLSISGNIDLVVSKNSTSWVYGIYVVAKGNLTIEEGVSISAENTNSGGAAAIVYFGNGDEEAPTTITINGGTIYGDTYGLCGNGSYPYSVVTINGGDITGGVVGYYHPESGTLTMTGGSITGTYVGLQICAGTIAISGGTITATANSSTVSSSSASAENKSGDGAIADGAAVSIVSRSGYGTPSVTITGGTFISASDVEAVQAYSYTQGKTSESDTTNTNTVTALDSDQTIVEVSGGSFSSALTGTYSSYVTASGFAVTTEANSDGYYTLTLASEDGDDNTYVAAVYLNGSDTFTAKYTSLADAFSDLADNYIGTSGEEGAVDLSSATIEIRLYANITDCASITNSCSSVTLNLNGYSITFASGSTLTNSGTLTITGSGSSTLTIVSNNPITNNTSATLTIESGVTIKSTYSASGAVYLIINNGTLYVTGGTVSSSLRTISNKGTMYVSGGTITSSGFAAIENTQSHTLYITGGTIYATTYAIYNSGTLEMSGGTLGVSTYSSRVAIQANTGSSATITGGYIIGTFSGATTDTLSISGGYFTDTGAGLYVATGYAINSETTTISEVAYYQVLAEENFAATINGVGYETLAAAISAATSGATIKIVKDITESVTVSDNELTIDLNGNTLTASGTIAITVARGATLYITDSSETEDSDGTGAIYGTWTVVNNGTLYVESGTITGSGNAVENYATAYINGGKLIAEAYSGIYNEGTLEVNGGTITGNNNGIYNYYNSSAASVTVNGGTVTGTYYNGIYSSAGSVTVNDGTVEGVTYSGICIENGGTVTVTGGEIKGAYAGIESHDSGTTTVSGGTISGGNYGVVNNGTLTMSAGTVSGKWAIQSQFNTSSTTITGGTIIGTSVGVVSYSAPITLGTEGGNDEDLVITGDEAVEIVGNASYGNGTVTMYSGTLGNCTIDGTTYESTWGVGMFGYSDSSYAVFTMYNGSITASSFGISGNGSTGQGYDKLYVYGGEITSVNAAAIYNPQQTGITYIMGGTITGKTGIEVRGGSVYIGEDYNTGDLYYEYAEELVITATGNPLSESENYSGSTISGAAIAIATYNLSNITIAVGEGTYTSASGYAVYESNVNNYETLTTTINVNLTDGTFDGIIYSETAEDNVTTFVITGGSYNSTTAAAYVDSNYLLNGTVNEDGYYTLIDNNTSEGGTSSVVATIVTDNGTVGFTSLQNAIDAATDGEETTITLASSITESSVTISADDSIILDLGGYTLTAKITNSGTLYITNGTLSGSIINYGTLYITDSAEIEESDTDGSSSSASLAKAKLAENEVTISSESAGVTNYGGDVTVESGASISGSKYGILSYGGTLTITDGTISGTTAAICCYGTELDISGGTFSGAVEFSACSGTISGGTFSSTVTIDGGTVTVTGGTYISTDIADYIDTTAYALAYNTDVTYTVTAISEFVATINGVGYTTLSAAVEAVPADGTETTITVLKELTKTSAITIASTKNVTIDLNGNTVTITGAVASYYCAVLNLGTLTITNGTLYASALNESGSMYTYGGIKNYGTLTIADDATIEGNLVVVANYGGTADIYGTVKAKYYVSGSAYYAVYNSSTENSVVNIYDGAYIFGYNAVSNYSTMNIYGGTVKSTTYSLNGSAGTLNIEGGTISGSFAIVNAGTTNISGGTITSTYSIQNNSTGTLNITGGSVSGKTAIYDLGGTVSISGGSITSYNIAIRTDGGTVNISGDTVVATTATEDSDSWVYGIYAAEASTVNVSGDATVTATNSNDSGSAAAIVYWGNSDEDTPTIINISDNVTISGDTFGLSGNGSASYTKVTITGGTIIGGAVGIYHPEMGTLTISEETGTVSITGVDSAIEIRSGTLIISGGTFTATYSDGETTATANGSGTTVKGAAIAISQHTTNNDISVTITGGTFNGVSAVYETDTYDSNGSISASLEGGTYNGDIYSSTVASTDEDGNTTSYALTVSGGTYTSTSAADYVVDGYLLGTADEDGYYTVVASTNFVASVDGIGYSTLQAAIDAAIEASSEDNVVEVTLLKATSEDITITGGYITLNLGGNVLTNSTSTSSTITINSGATVTIEDGYIYNTATSTSVPAIYMYSGSTVTIGNGATVNGYVGIRNGNSTATLGGTLEVEEGATVYGTYAAIMSYGDVTVSGGTIEGGFGVVVYGMVSDDRTQLTVTSGSITGTINAAISTNGSVNSSNVALYGYVDITISGGTITGEGANTTAIYLPSQNTTTTITGGTITGVASGIEIRNGTLVIGTEDGDNSGIEITSTATTSTTQNATPSGGGETIIGAAIAISSYNQNDISVTINSGTFTGATAVYEGYTGTSELTADISLSITDGTFNGYIYAENVEEFITGGVYSDTSAAAYVAEGSALSGETTEIDGVLYYGIVATSSDDPDVDTVVATITTDGVTLSYTSLEKAIAAANDGDEIVLVADVTESVTITSGKNVTLNLSSYGIAVESGAAITVESGATLTVTGNGTITGVTRGISSYGDLTINGGTISGGYGVVSISGSLNITAGTINGTSTYGVYTAENATISGGTISGTWAVVQMGGSLEITGGTITATNSNSSAIGVYAYYGLTTNISGGTITATSSGDNYSYGVYTYGTANISGDVEITATANTSKYAAYGVVVNTYTGNTSSSCVNVSGSAVITATNASGNSAGIAYFANGDEDTPTKVTISGGTISGGTYGLSGNGAESNYSEVVISGGTISGNWAYYHPEDGTLTISGGEFIGVYSALQICSGTVTITGGTFETTATTDSLEASDDYYGTKTGSGPLADGAAISVVDRSGYTDTPYVAISGGTFISASGNAVLAYSNKDGNSFTDTWEDAGDSIEISGGYYSSIPANSEYYADGLVPTAITISGTNYYTVVTGEFVTAPAADETEFYYNGEEQTYTLTENTDAYTISGNVQTEAGTYTVTVTLNDGYMWNDTFSTKAREYTFTINSAVAVIGTTGYATLQDAIDAAQDNDTITLVADTTESVTITSGTIILDLNGYTLTNDGDHTITVKSGATLTIIDSVGGGVVDNVTHAKAAIYNEGTVYLYGGTYTRSAEAGKSTSNNGGNSYYVILNHGTMVIGSETDETLNNVTVQTVDSEGNLTGKYSSLIENGWQDGSQNTSATSASLTINGGTFQGGLNTVKNDDYGVLTINDGTFVNDNQYAVMNYNTATINGGTFTGKTYAVWVNSTSTGYDAGTLTINGGTFTGNSYAVYVTSGTLTITDGTFTNGVKVWTNSTATISGGEFTGKTYALYVTTATVTVTGGTFVGGTSDAIYIGGSSTATLGSTDGENAALLVSVTTEGKYAVNVNGNVSSMSILSGTYEGAINSKYATSFISGGVYSDTSAAAYVADGYALNGTVNEDGYYGIIEASTEEGGNNEVVATITTDGVTLSYTTLQAAIDAAGEDETIILTADVTESSVTISADDIITIDLGGNTLTANIYNYGTLTISDTAADTNSLTGTIYNYNILTISGGSVSCTAPASSASLAKLVLTSNGGTEYNAIVNYGGTVTVTDGTVYGETYGITSYGGSVTISGGTVSGVTGAIYCEGTTLTISGGTVSGSIVTDGNCTVNITGGYFSDTDIAEYLDTENYLLNSVASDNLYQVLAATEFAARIGNIGYATLQDAIDAAASGDTIVLISDVTENITIGDSKTITLDLNGNEITNDGDHTITVETGATLTITDSVGGGTVDNVTNGKAAIYNEGEVTIEGGTYTRSAEADGNTYYVILNHGTMTIGTDGGTNDITVQSDGTTSSLIENGWYTPSENTSETTAYLTIYGGKFTGGLNTVKNDEYGELVIYDGTFTNTTMYAVLTYNTATIYGGTFTGNNYAVYAEKTSDTYGVAELTINGGTFTGSRYALWAKGATLEITEGTFNGGLYITNNSTATIKGGEFNGGTYAYTLYTAKSTVTVTGGTFVGASSGSGSSVFYIINTGTVTLGEEDGDNSAIIVDANGKKYAVYIYKNATDVSILSGTYEGTVYSQELTGFISGGQYSVMPADSTYYAEGLMPTQLVNGYYTVIEGTIIGVPEDTTITYDGEGHYLAASGTGYAVVSVTDSSNEDVANGVATDVGEYTVTVTLLSGYMWSDLTTEEKTYTVTIANASVDKPSENTATFTYDGSEQTYLESTAYYTVTNGTQTDAGTYTVTVTLNDGYTWSDDSTDTLTFSWTIGMADNSISVTIEGWTYGAYDADTNTPVATTTDGDSITYTYYSDEACTTEVTSFTPATANAGTYWVVATVAATDNYNSATSEAVSFVIAKAENSVTVSIDGWTYGENNNTATATTTDGTATVTYYKDAACTESISESDLATAGAGTYYVVATVAETTNYNAASATTSFVIAKGTMTVTASGYSDTYDGSAHTGSVTSTASGYSVAYGTTEGTYDETSAPEYTNAGTYVVYYKVTADNYEDVTGSFIVEIAKATYDMDGVSFSDTTVTYDGDEHSIVISGTLPTGVSVTYVGSGTNAGTYTITAIFTGDSDNYEAIDYKTATLTISKATVTAPTAGTSSYTYDGTTKTYTLDTNDAYTISGTTSATNAGTYTVTVVLNDTTNYTWSNGTTAAITYSWTINAQSVSVPTLNASTYTYDGTTFTFVNSGTGYNVYNGTGSEVGTYTVTVSLASSNYVWSTGSTADITYTVVIVEAGTTTVINEPTITTTSYTYTGAEIEFLTSGTGYTVYNGSGTNVGEYTVVVTLSANYIWSDGTSTAKTYTFTITSAEITAPSEDTTEFTYTGSELTYTLDTNDAYTISGNKQTDAGTYTVTVTLNDTINYVWADGSTDPVTYTWTIAKATYDMSEVTLSDTTVTYDGTEHSIVIAGTLPDGVEVSYVGSGTNAGEYTVTAIFTGDSANYEAIANMTATLTIEKATYDMSGVTLSDTTVTYDGDEHSIVIAGTLPDGVEVSYVGSGTNAGEYTVTAIFTGDSANYEAIANMT
ncbi:MAG: hypothetical protein LUF82_00945, partial [Clostridia bacterium]|nr:hypothetical protein [Clostridia bacterium]